MKTVRDIGELFIGAKIRIVGKCEKDTQFATVCNIVNDGEVIINEHMNKYFIFKLYKGGVSWVESLYLLESEEVSNKLNRLERELKSKDAIIAKRNEQIADYSEVLSAMKVIGNGLSFNNVSLSKERVLEMSQQARQVLKKWTEVKK